LTIKPNNGQNLYGEFRAKKNCALHKGIKKSLYEEMFGASKESIWQIAIATMLLAGVGHVSAIRLRCRHSKEDLICDGGNST
jgi:hypothetical protein